MLKVFTGFLILLSPALTITAQEQPAHSIAELKTLLQNTNNDSIRANLLLETSLVYVLKPGMDKTDFDSAMFFVKQVTNMPGYSNKPVLQAKCYTLYSQLYRESDQKEKGKQYIENAISILDKYNTKQELANANMELQSYYSIYSANEMDLKIASIEKAQKLYEETGNKISQAGALQLLGDCYQVRKSYDTALTCLNKALAIYKSMKYEELQGIYGLIGHVHHLRGDYQQALKYELMAVEIAEKLNIHGQELSTIYNRVGLTYYRLMQYQSAAKYFEPAFSAAIKNKDTSSARIIAPNLIDAYLRLKKPAELIVFLQKTRFMYDRKDLNFKEIYLGSHILGYLLTSDYKKAKPFVTELHRLVSDTSTRNQRNLYRCVLPYYLAAGEYKKMYKYLAANEEYCKKNKTISGLADNYQWWYKADSALGNMKDAITHYQSYKEASDSLLRYTASQQVNQLMIQHETYKKDQEIASKESNIVLLTNQAKLQQDQLVQTRLVRNLSYCLAGLFLMVAGLLFNRYRLKQRSNKRLEQQQQEINDKNVALQKVVNQKEKLLVEKQLLLKEVHHRVKNNMHIVMSLLNLQSAYIDNEMALSAIRESENRVHAMSLIHQKLYNTENVSSIDMSIYIRELVSYLNDSFNTGQRIRFEFVIEAVELDVSQAVPLGLILNEAITNSIKYAFPGERRGLIVISLSGNGSHQYSLTVSDNGVGMPTGLKQKTGSLGMSLMEGLSGDLNGNFSIESDNGTTIRITFVDNHGAKRSDATRYASAHG